MVRKNAEVIINKANCLYKLVLVNLIIKGKADVLILRNLKENVIVTITNNSRGD